MVDGQVGFFFFLVVHPLLLPGKVPCSVQDWLNRPFQAERRVKKKGRKKERRLKNPCRAFSVNEPIPCNPSPLLQQSNALREAPMSPAGRPEAIENPVI
jgi:hypothetical protein